MRMFKVMIIAILSVLLILSGCEKDEVAPIAEKTIDLEQSTEQIPTENKDNQKSATDSQEELIQEQKNSPENSTSSNNSNNISEEETKDGEKATQERTKETTEQQSKTTASTNKSTTITEVKETNKASTTTQKTQTSTDNKATTNESNEKETTAQKVQITTPPPKKVEPKQTVTISIVGDEQKGTILSATKVDMKEGNTVLDVTLVILKQKGIPISVRGSGSSAYVEGIANLFEFDRGPLSGWTVNRNGAKLGQSSGAIQVKNGDSVQWIYTSNYEEDTK